MSSMCEKGGQPELVDITLIRKLNYDNTFCRVTLGVRWSVYRAVLLDGHWLVPLHLVMVVEIGYHLEYTLMFMYIL